MVNTEIRLIIFFATNDGEALYSQQKQDWKLTGSDHELLIAKFRLKLKNVGKTTRPFRYELNQIPYDYTVEVRNRFKGLDLIDSLMNYGQRFVTLYRRQGSRPSPRKRNEKSQNGCLRRPYKWLKKEEKWKAKEKRKDIPIWMQSLNLHWIIKKAREFQKDIYVCFIDDAKAFNCVDHNKLWKILKEMWIPDHLTCLLRNLYAGQESTVRTWHGTTDWFQIRKGVGQGCILSPCLFKLYAEYIMQNASLDEAQAGMKIPGEISITSFMQMTPPLWQKAKSN